ncbi:MAG: hypothetical protein L0G62_00895 [Micrococcaceae bacterium]|nr:hypothetical protein [Micrococcaceae bacterium]
MSLLARAGHAALSWPSLLLAVTVCAFTLHGLTLVAELPDANGWDVAVPQIGNLQLLPLLTVLLWTPVVIARHRGLTREEVLLRLGSWRSATAAVLAGDAAVLVGGLCLSVASVLLISAGRSLDGGWSVHALRIFADGGVDTEVSATAAAALVGQPWLFLVLQVAWLVLGLWSIAALHAAVLVRVGARPAHGALIAVGVWGVLAGSGVLGARPFPDLSAWTNLLWAAASPPSVVLTVAVWLLAGTAAHGAAAGRDGLRRSGRLRLLTLPLALALSAGLLILGGWSATRAEGVEAAGGLLDAVFGGQHSSLMAYTLAAVPAITATGFVAARLSDLDDGGLELILLRHGSTGRWARALLVRILALAAVVAVGLVALTVLADRWLTPAAAAREPAEWMMLALAYALFCLILAIPAVALLWLRGHAREWPLVVLGVLLFGYPSVLPASAANPLAPFSLEPGTPLTAVPLLSALALLVLLGAATAGLMFRHPLPRPS